MGRAGLDIRYGQKRVFFCKGEYKRPPIKLEIYRVDNTLKAKVWEIFRRYHYLNTGIHTGAEQWVGIYDNQLVAHTGVMQYPLKKGWKRIHRLVVLPDYQGVGIGMKFLEAVCEHYYKDGWVVNCTTTTPQMVNAMVRRKQWALKRYGRVASQKGLPNHLSESSSAGRITYSFYYQGMD